MEYNGGTGPSVIDWRAGSVHNRGWQGGDLNWTVKAYVTAAGGYSPLLLALHLSFLVLVRSNHDAGNDGRARQDLLGLSCSERSHVQKR